MPVVPRFTKEKEKEAILKAADMATIQIAKLLRQKVQLELRIEKLRQVIATRDEVFQREPRFMNPQIVGFERVAYSLLASRVHEVLSYEWISPPQIQKILYGKYMTMYMGDSIRRALYRGMKQGLYERENGKFRKVVKETIKESVDEKNKPEESHQEIS